MEWKLHQDAGASKTEKAQKFKTACLTEDQLIGLVADLSRKAGVDPWAWKTGAVRLSYDLEIETVGICVHINIHEWRGFQPILFNAFQINTV